MFRYWILFDYPLYARNCVFVWTHSSIIIWIIKCIFVGSSITLAISAFMLWTLSAMMSKSNNGGDSWGTLYGRPMEGLVFRYNWHEKITRYIQMRDMHYYPMVMHVFCLPLKFFGWFCYSRCHKVRFNIEYVSQDMYTDFFTLTLVNYFCLNKFLYKSPPTIAAIFTFWCQCG